MTGLQGTNTRPCPRKPLTSWKRTVECRPLPRLTTWRELAACEQPTPARAGHKCVTASCRAPVRFRLDGFLGDLPLRRPAWTSCNASSAASTHRSRRDGAWVLNVRALMPLVCAVRLPSLPICPCRSAGHRNRGIQVHYRVSLKWPPFMPF